VSLAVFSSGVFSAMRARCKSRLEGAYFRSFPMSIPSGVCPAEGSWHFGQGRQMVPGQKIHKSVHNRLVYDQESRRLLPRAQRYCGPAAVVAEDMPSWALVREGRATDSDAWAE
jgi:hypothetical protein